MLLTKLLEASKCESNSFATLSDNSVFLSYQNSSDKMFWIWMNVVLKAGDDVLDCAKCTRRTETVGETSS